MNTQYLEKAPNSAFSLLKEHIRAYALEESTLQSGIKQTSCLHLGTPDHNTFTFTIDGLVGQ